jgi:hypothetical protein
MVLIAYVLLKSRHDTGACLTERGTILIEIAET